MKLAFFYPENGDRVTNFHNEFASVQEAQDYLVKLSSQWGQIDAQNPADVAAFLHHESGEVLVLRQLLA